MPYSSENLHEKKRIPSFGIFGFLLMIIFWYLNWNLDGVRTHWAFFPMWLGFILFLNGLTFYFKSTCILSRSRFLFIVLFLISAPMWWIFEFFNERVHYWIYLPQDWLPRWKYILFASINFSVVLPGIFSAGELCSAFRIFQKAPNFIYIGRRKWDAYILFILGWMMLAITLIWPQYSMAFLWMSLFFIFDPINYWIGFPSILSQTSKADWRLVWSLWVGSLICGFAWELWNYYSYPKWIYQIPYVDFWYLFEMPILGYLGYLPFSLELFAMYSLIAGIFNWKFSFIEFDSKSMGN